MQMILIKLISIYKMLWGQKMTKWKKEECWIVEGIDLSDNNSCD